VTPLVAATYVYRTDRPPGTHLRCLVRPATTRRPLTSSFLSAARLGFLGLTADTEANTQHGRLTAGRISPPTDEELMTARLTL